MDKEIKKYLSNIVNKLIRLDQKVTMLEQKIVLLGKANGEAYRRVEKVVNHLSENQTEVYEILDG